MYQWPSNVCINLGITSSDLEKCKLLGLTLRASRLVDHVGPRNLYFYWAALCNSNASGPYSGTVYNTIWLLKRAPKFACDIYTHFSSFLGSPLSHISSFANGLMTNLSTRRTHIKTLSALKLQVVFCAGVVVERTVSHIRRYYHFLKTAQVMHVYMLIEKFKQCRRL